MDVGADAMRNDNDEVDQLLHERPDGDARAVLSKKGKCRCKLKRKAILSKHANEQKSSCQYLNSNDTNDKILCPAMGFGFWHRKEASQNQKRSHK